MTMSSRRAQVVARVRDGADHGEIAEALELTYDQVKWDVYQARRLGELPPFKASNGWKGPERRGRPKNPPTTPRRCLGVCGKDFPSAGIHNRLCAACRARAERGVAEAECVLPAGPAP